MYCPRCAAAMEEHNGELKCTASGALVSRFGSEQLHAVVDRTADPAERQTNPGVSWGVRWFCPADAQPLREVDGILECDACGRTLAGFLIYHLIEMNPH
jgi:hypothetical protein